MDAEVAFVVVSSSGLNFEVNFGWRRKEDLEGQRRLIDISSMTHLDGPHIPV